MKRIIAAALMVFAVSVHASDTWNELPKNPREDQISNYQYSQATGYTYKQEQTKQQLKSADFHKIWWPRWIRLYAYKSDEQFNQYHADTAGLTSTKTKLENYRKWHVHAEAEIEALKRIAANIIEHDIRQPELIKTRHAVRNWRLFTAATAVSTCIAGWYFGTTNQSAARGPIITTALIFGTGLSALETREYTKKLKKLARRRNLAVQACNNIISTRSPEETDFASPDDCLIYNNIIEQYRPRP